MLKIRELREKKNITQDEISSETSIPKRTYLNYESGKSDIPFSKLQKIATFLNVSISEIIGEEESGIQILNNNRKTKDIILDIQDIPLYDFEATAGLVEFFKSDKPTNELETIRIPNIPRCDGATTVTGDSMYPLLKSGDIILYKEVPVERHSIFFGEMYLLGVMIDEYEEMVTVKYVQKSELGDDYIKLVSQNQHHQPKDILLSSVTAMAMVKVSIRKNTFS